MTFAEKLNFLMDITKTSNSALAARVSLDASYISRMRSGKRLMPKDERVMQVMAAYFARHADAEYQKKALSDALRLKSLPEGTALAEGLAHWLIHGDAGSAQRVELFLNGLSGMGARPSTTHQADPLPLSYPQESVSVYHGIEGKRRAAENFLQEVAAREKPQTLLLFSDEETSWMTADPE